MEKQAHRWQSIDEILVKLNKRSNVWPKWVIAICSICVVGFISWQLIEKNTQISHAVIDVNNIKYSNFNSRDNTCHAIGQGPIKLANVYIRESVDYDGEEYQVTAIANAAFKSLSHLKSVHIPHGITQIGKSAFLKCDSILVINIPNSVTEVGENAFYSCRGVRELNLSHNLKEIPTSGFVSTQISRLTIHEGVENIRMDAFAHSANIKNVKIPSSVKHIERGVFYNCVGLEKIELPLWTMVSPELLSMIEYDRQKDTQYFETFREYLLNERDIPKTSEKLIIHRTTLLYRLKKIQAMLNVNLEDPWERLYLMLSLWILEQQNQ